MITVKVPATTANLGPGFDTLGLALSLFLEVNIELSEENRIDCAGEDAARLNRNTEENLVFKAANIVLQKAGMCNQCLHIQINNAIPLGKGMGSSASAIAAGMFGANQLLGTPYSTEQLLKWAVALEGHADNIVPAVFGGLTTALVSKGEVLWQKIHPPDSLKLVVAVPDFDLPTQQARLVLPEQIHLHEAVQTMQKACFLMASMANGNFESLQAAMNDELIQPRRKAFIPGFDQVVEAALQGGAHGVALSGAGPSMIAITDNHEKEIGTLMQEAFRKFSVETKVLVLNPCNEGMTMMFS